MQKIRMLMMTAIVASGVAAAGSDDDFWDTTGRVETEPNFQTAVLSALDAESCSCASAAAETFDSLAWTEHLSDVLKVFRSTPPCGVFLLIR